MKNQATIQELCELSGKSKASVYALLRKNEAFVKENSNRRQRTVYYNQAIIQLVKEYYGVDSFSDVAEAVEERKSQEDSNSLLDEIKAELETVKAENEALKEQLRKADAERQELVKQNGLMLLMLNEERQERLKLLEAPKKSFIQRVKDVFGKSKE